MNKKFLYDEVMELTQLLGPTYRDNWVDEVEYFSTCDIVNKINKLAMDDLNYPYSLTNSASLKSWDVLLDEAMKNVGNTYNYHDVIIDIIKENDSYLVSYKGGITIDIKKCPIKYDVANEFISLIAHIVWTETNEESLHKKFLNDIREVMSSLAIRCLDFKVAPFANGFEDDFSYRFNFVFNQPLSKSVFRTFAELFKEKLFYKVIGNDQFDLLVTGSSNVWTGVWIKTKLVHTSKSENNSFFD